VEKLATARFDLVSLGRNLRSQFNIPANRKVRFVFRPSAEIARSDAEVIQWLLNAETMELVPAAWNPERGTPSAANAMGELFLPLAGQIDAAAERVRLTRDLEKVRSEVRKVRGKLDDANFTQKVPAKVLEDHRQRLRDWQSREQQVLAALDNLP
jgi:valyl-tRNA synthetase